MSSDLKTVRDAKTVLLTTYKRDGTPVETPVSIAFEGNRAFFRSYHQAWKTDACATIPRSKSPPRPSAASAPVRPSMLAQLC